jgi:hypothetical protein
MASVLNQLIATPISTVRWESAQTSKRLAPLASTEMSVGARRLASLITLAQLLACALNT